MFARKKFTLFTFLGRFPFIGILISLILLQVLALKLSVKLITALKPGSHMSLLFGDLLSVTIQGENSQRILIMSNHRQ